MINKPAHDSGKCRFSLQIDGQECVLDYRRSGSLMTITHTGVPDAVSGRGLAATLMTAALDFARAEGLKVNPACAYASAFMGKHPEYADLKA